MRENEKMESDRVIFQTPASCQDLVTDINLETLENLPNLLRFIEFFKKFDYLISRQVSGITFKKTRLNLRWFTESMVRNMHHQA